MQYKEGQRLQGSDGKVYVVQGGVPREQLGQPSPSAQPGVQVVGTPRPKPPELRQVGDSLGLVDPQTGNFTPTYTPPSKPKEEKPTDSANTAAFLATRVAGGMKDIAAALKENPGNEKPGVLATIAGIAGDDARNLANNPARQRIEAAQMDILDAALTLGTGAAYSKEQLEGYRRSYFPQIGDDPATVADKQARLRRVLEAAKVKAGAAAPSIDEALAALDGQSAPTAQLSNEQLDAQLKERIRRRESPAAIVAWLQQNGQPVTDDTLKAIMANMGNPAPDVQRPSEFAQNFASGAGDVVEGVGDAIGLFANPINAASNAAFGTNFTTDYGHDLRTATGLPDNTPSVLKAINTAGAGALTGAGVARSLGNGLTGAAGTILNNLGAEPIRQGIAGATAGGATELAHQGNVGPLGEMAAGLAGGLAGYGGANALLRVGAGSGPSQIAKIAARQNVDLMPQDVGGATTRRVTASAAQTPLSAEPVVNAAQRTQSQLKEAAARTGRSSGNVLPADDAGEAVRAAGRDYVPKQSARIGKVYDRAEERAKGVSIKPIAATKVIDEQIAKLSTLGETNAPLIRSLEKLKSDIAGGVKVSGLRDARTTLSQGVYDGKLRSNQEKHIYRQVIDALSTDIEAGLSAAGRKDALNLFKMADKGWKERIQYIDDVLEPVIGGKKSGEQILSSIEQMAQGKGGGVSRLSGILREMPEDTAGNVRATIIERLGKAAPGQQDASGEAFSSNTFLTNWNKMSAKGKAALFGTGDLRRNLDEIGELAGQVRESSKYANSSNTSGGVWGNIGVLAGVGLNNPKTAVTVGVLQYATGRLMASPAFARWLARVPNNPAMIQRHEGQLAQIAAREPLIANDIASIQQYLSSATQRAAASPKDQSE